MNARGFVPRIAILVAALSLLPALPAEARTPSRLEQTRRQIRSTRSLLHSAQNKDHNITTALTRYSNLLSMEMGNLRNARLHLRSINFEIEQTERRIARLDRERRARAATISARARALYVMGPVNGFTAIAKAGSLQDFIGRAGALQFIGTFDRTVLQDIARIKHETNQNRLALSSQRQTSLHLAEQVRDRALAVGEIVIAKSDAHKEMQDLIRGYQDEIAALQAEENRIEGIINSRSGYYGAPSARGFAWPTLGRHITSPYGYRWGGFHSGIDIDCRTGDPIAASKDGRVIASEYSGGYGNMVVIDHGGGFASLYAHLSRIYAHDGEVVDQHQLVGACGATGHATGDHLHFEIRINGHHVNPRPYLP